MSGFQGRWTEAASLFRELTAARPGDPQLWYRLGRARQESGRPSEAIEAYRRAFGLGYLYGAWIPYQVARSRLPDLRRTPMPGGTRERAISTAP